MRRWGEAVVAGLVVVAAFAGCESNPPEILALEWTLYDFHDRDHDLEYEVLSLFVSASDVDGSDDLDALYIISDGSELFWTLDADSWLRDETGDELWIGATTLAMPARGAFPAGRYRVVLVDVAGDSTEREFVLASRRGAPARPGIDLQGATLTLTGPGVHEVWIIAWDELVTTTAVTAALNSPAVVELADLLGEGEAARGDAQSYEIYVVTRSPQAAKQAMVGPFFWQNCRRAESNC